MALERYPVNKDVRWIKDNTHPDQFFLNTNLSCLTRHPLPRKNDLYGMAYFAWSAGYEYP